MCDYLAAVPRMDHPEALMSVVRGMILDGLLRHGGRRVVAPEVLAALVSGAIYGAVNEWERMVDRCTPEELGRSIRSLVGPMMLTGQDG